jgi:FeS assembly protein IscX
VSVEELYWDSSYAIARRLIAAHPRVDLSTVTLNMIYDWVLALPDFVDDPQLVNDDLLQAIYQEWYETRLDNELHANRPADAG